MRLTIYDCITTSYCPSEQRLSKDRWNWQTITSSTSHTVLLNIILRVIKESETKKPKREILFIKKKRRLPTKETKRRPFKDNAGNQGWESGGFYAASAASASALPHPCRQATSNKSEAGIICLYLWITWSFFSLWILKEKKCFFKCSL